jgi:CRISPR-associated endonuclease/helicase Cas3
MKILAKSDPAISLKQHINDGLLIYEKLKNSFINLPNTIDQENFWKLLKFCIIFHDLGKAHNEFQKLLIGKPNNWKQQRHELFSLPFVQALAIKDKEFVYLVVAGHHKDFEKLICHLESYSLSGDDFGLDLGGTEDVLSFDKEFESNLFIKPVLALLADYNIKIGSPIIHNPHSKLQSFVQQKIEDKNEHIKLLLLAGAFKHCDHLSSAGISNIYKLSVADFQFLFNSDFEFYEHQKTANQISGNAILTAPTGSGKTETSLLWLENHIKKNANGRVFYILPFTASINAMYERLSMEIPNRIGLLHGKLSAFIESKFENDDLVDENYKKEIKEQYKTLITPFKVVTPFQLLKNIFSLKGFEKGIFEWAGGYFIFDEIHAYNPTVFAQIISLLEFAIKYLNVKVFVMTATLPTFLRRELESSLGEYSTITTSRKLYEKFNRHRIVVKTGKLNDNLALIQDYLDKGKKVLVVCNTVKNAQIVFETLQSDNKVLLHGAFNATDRNTKEKELSKDDVMLLVGTQAIEVSLDIDYDNIFTEPAPLDALIQRFGRVNRKRIKGISDCFVFEERNDSDRYIYKNESVIDRTINVLKEKENINSGIIEEIELQQMMDFVYPEWDKEDKDVFDKIHSLLNDFIENQMKPFVYNQKQEEDFYNQFDGIKVLPLCNLGEFEKLIAENKFIKAESLKVQVSTKRFMQLISEDSIDKEYYATLNKEHNRIKENYVYVIKKKYSSEMGLLIDEDEISTSVENQIF